MAKEQVESKNFISRGMEFCRESWAELKKVHSPSRQETINLTIRVFGMVCLFGVFLGLTDFFVGWVMRSILT